MEYSTTKVVLVTGASSGIGAATAKAFAKQNASLCIIGRNKENLSAVGKECKSLGAKQVLEIIADLNKKEEIEKIFKLTSETYDKLDVLVNNAGLWRLGNIEATQFEVYNQLFNVNVRAPLFLTQLFVPYLEKSEGCVVNISSIGGQGHYPQAIVYGMTKSSLDQFTKTGALDLAKKKIRMNAVSPALCETNIFAECKMDISIEEFVAIGAKRHPLRERNIDVGEVVDAVLFLASDSARMVTGVCLNVDGGRCLVSQ